MNKLDKNVDDMAMAFFVVVVEWGWGEGADAQEAHLYAFPLITGRGRWLPLHNGFASASLLQPDSLGEEERAAPKAAGWPSKQDCVGTLNASDTQMHVSDFGATKFVMRKTVLTGVKRNSFMLQFSRCLT